MHVLVLFHISLFTILNNVDGLCRSLPYGCVCKGQVGGFDNMNIELIENLAIKRPKLKYHNMSTQYGMS